MNIKQNGGCVLYRYVSKQGKWRNLMKVLTNHQVSREVTNASISLCKQQLNDTLF